MTEGVLIIYVSPNGRENWQPVLPQDVPEWLKDPDILGELVSGEMACKADEEIPVWYRAEKVESGQSETE